MIGGKYCRIGIMVGLAFLEHKDLRAESRDLTPTHERRLSMPSWLSYRGRKKEMRRFKGSSQLPPFTERKEESPLPEESK